MAETISAYPLQWPVGWKRTAPAWRGSAKFNHRGRDLTINDAVARVRNELRRMGVGEDCVISTNLVLRLDGFPKSGQAEPMDPGAAVYWRESGQVTRCMAIDRYDRVADNLAAIAATLDAMRAIERHGGAEILERAFTGFQALPAPDAKRQWWEVLGVPRSAAADEIRTAYRRLASDHHPDKGGSAERMAEINAAYKDATA